VPPELIAEIEKDTKGHRGEPKAVARSLSATNQLDLKTVPRALEEHGGDLDAALMGTHRIRPTGPVQICGEIMQDGPMCVDVGYGAGPNVKVTQEGSNGSIGDVQSHEMTDTTCQVTPSATCPNMHSASVPDPRPKGNGTPEKHQDIFIQTPRGKGVPEHEIQWGPNPHRSTCGDTSQLLEIVPDHHHFKASYLATAYYNLVKTDLRSQFYKTPPTGESSLTSRPPWSRDKGRTIKRQELYASRRLARAIAGKEKTETTSPRVNVTAPSPNQKQGPDTNLGVSQEPTLTETNATLHDNSLFYKNGNPKPKTNPIVRPLPRGLTSRARKRQGGRKRKRRRNRHGRPSDEASQELNPTTTERTQGGDDPTQTRSDAIPLSPHQHMGTLPRTPLVEPEMENGAACFGPNTALLIQDPFNWTAHAPVETLTRPIGSLKYGDTVLAEKH